MDMSIPLADSYKLLFTLICGTCLLLFRLNVPYYPVLQGDLSHPHRLPVIQCCLIPIAVSGLLQKAVCKSKEH